MISFLRSSAIVLALLVTSLQAQDSTEAKAAVEAVEKEFAAAVIGSDVEAILSKLAEDWALITADGSKVTRAQLEKLLRDGTLKMEASSPSEMEIRIYGETAIVTGRERAKGRLDGEPFELNQRFTDVLIRKDGKWLFVATHTSLLAE